MRGLDRCDIMYQANDSAERSYAAPERMILRMAKEKKMDKKVEQITDMEVDFAQWFTDV